MITKTLETVGMTERQAKLYITGLKMGASSASDISTKAKENRVTTYKTLQEMTILGYCKEFKKGNKIMFAMINPDELLQQQKEKTRALEKAVPEIVGLMKTFSEKPKIMVYEGLEGLKTLFQTILDNNEDIRLFVGGGQIDPEFNDFIKNHYIPQRIHKSFKTKSIVSKSNEFYEDYLKENRTKIIIQNELFESANEVIIYDYTKVAICHYESGELSAFVINSKTFHDCMAGVFDTLSSTLTQIQK